MNDEATSERYMDGSTAKEIEHMLVCNLHSLNTIEELNDVKYTIHNLMTDLFNKGQMRDEKEKKNENQ